MSTSVAVTAVGGGVGQSILKSLKAAEYRSVGIDPHIRAAGLYMADVGYLGKERTEDGFIERLIEICKAEDCKYLFPGFDAELPILTQHVEDFRAEGIVPIVSSPEVISLGNSKAKLTHFLKDNGFPFIPTATDFFVARSLQFPIIVKPDAGCRSQGMDRFDSSLDFIMEDGTELDFGYGKLIAQEYIEGEEYTCGTVSFDGNVLGVIAMSRELRDGDTYKAQVNQNPMVVGFVHKLVSAIKPFGPCNVQLRLRNAIPYVLEINVRCSGTTGARTLAGFNEPKMVIDYLEGRPVEHNIQPIEILRYWNEMVVYPGDREKIKS